MITRLLLTIINIFFPPLTVLLITGPYTDTLVNCFLFLAGVIPSHIHAFYISCTYFHRKSKVRKGKYPGGRKNFIYDKKVWNGGASDERVEELWERHEEGKRASVEKKGGGVSKMRNQRGSVYNGESQVGDGSERRSKMYTNSGSQVGGKGDRRSRMSDGVGRRRTVVDEMSGRY